MSAEWLNAGAALGTLILIAASAVAALLQMRHLRSANQIIALTEVRKTMESPEFHEALMYVLRELPTLTQDSEIRRKMLEMPLPKEFEQARTVANFFENLGVFVKHGALGRSITCDMWGYGILQSWDRLAPLIANRRHAAKNPALYENFEYLAVLSRRFRQRYPTGAYPRDVPHMPAADVWPEAT